MSIMVTFDYPCGCKHMYDDVMFRGELKCIKPCKDHWSQWNRLMYIVYGKEVEKEER